jgi:hypothetical protein
MTDAEDEVPPGQAKNLRRPRARAAGWEWPVRLLGYVIFAAIAVNAVSATHELLQEHREYLATPVCTIPAADTAAGSGATVCPATDRIDETATAVQLTVVASGKNDTDSTLTIYIHDPSDTVALPGISFTSESNQPPLDPKADVGRELYAEVYNGTVTWVALSANGEHYQSDASIVSHTAYPGVSLLILAGSYLVFACLTWWLLVRRGAVADQDVYRPLVLLASLVTGLVGYLMLTRYEATGSTVLIFAMALATLLGAPALPRLRGRLPTPSSWPRLARTRWSGRRGTRGHDEIFR